MTFIDQTTRKFPVDALTKLHPKESFKTIKKRYEKLKYCDWLYSQKSLLEVINKPWIPQHDARKYIQETEPLSDFQYLLESGINELKTEDIEKSETTNILTFYNELRYLYDSKDTYSNAKTFIPILIIKNIKAETLS